MSDTLQPLVQDFFTKLGIKVDSVTVEVIGEDINVNLQTPDSSLIIGMHGKSIDSFQHLLGRMIEKKVEKFVHIHLEVNDYIKQKDERLHRFLESKIAFVTTTGKSVRMPNLTAYERKKAHNYVSEKWMEWLKTQSEGEGAERALVLSYTGTLVASTTPSGASRPIGDDLSEDGIGI